MTDLPRIDRIMLQLRAQLDRSRAAERRAEAPPTGIGARAIDRLAGEQGEEPQFRRRLIRALLLDELGADLVGEAELERISDQVWQLLEREPEGRALLAAAARQLPSVRKGG